MCACACVCVRLTSLVAQPLPAEQRQCRGAAPMQAAAHEASSKCRPAMPRNCSPSRTRAARHQAIREEGICCSQRRMSVSGGVSGGGCGRRIKGAKHPLSVDLGAQARDCSMRLSRPLPMSVAQALCSAPRLTLLSGQGKREPPAVSSAQGAGTAGSLQAAKQAHVNAAGEGPRLGTDLVLGSADVAFCTDLVLGSADVARSGPIHTCCKGSCCCLSGRRPCCPTVVGAVCVLHQW
eukprot:362394-Chlamydomonas_euryale.AAC.2